MSAASRWKTSWSEPDEQTLFSRRRLALGLRWRRLVALGQDRLEGSADLRELCRVLNLMAEQVLDVENVDDLFAIGRNLGARHLKIETRQRSRELKQQSRPVSAVDLDDRVRGARLVVDEHAGSHGEHPRPTRESRWAGEHAVGLQIAGEHVLEGRRELGELVRTVERPAGRILDPEG